MPSTQSPVRSVSPTTSQGLVTSSSDRPSSVTSSNALANYPTNSSKTCTPFSNSGPSSKWIRPLSEHTGSKKHRITNTTPAIPELFEAASVPEEGDTSPARSNTSIDIKSRRLSFVSFILSTAPPMEEAIHIGTENQVKPDADCAKSSVVQSRRKRILHFFKGHHKKRRSTDVYNDFLAPGLVLKDRDRKILDRLDFSTLSKFQ